jgi:hypothetical protein
MHERIGLEYGWSSQQTLTAVDHTSAWYQESSKSSSASSPESEYLMTVLFSLESSPALRISASSMNSGAFFFRGVALGFLVGDSPLEMAAAAIFACQLGTKTNIRFHSYHWWHACGEWVWLALQVRWHRQSLPHLQQLQL